MDNKLSEIVQFLHRNRTRIMLYGGIGGMWFTVGYTAKFAPVIKTKIEEALKEHNRKRREKSEEEGYAYCEEAKHLPLMDTVRVVGKYIVVPAVVGGVSTYLLFKANSLNEANLATLAAAYSIAEKTAAEYKDAVKEVVGEKKETEIRDAVAKNAITNNPPPQQIIVNGDGQLFYDSMSGRYFQSNLNRIERACNTLNRRMQADPFDDAAITLNDFYLEIGLNPIEMGNHLGWDRYYGNIDTYISHQPTINDMYCAVVEFTKPPIWLASKKRCYQ